VDNEKNYDVDGLMNELMKVIREPEYASQEFIATVAMTLEISGKSIKTLFNGLSLLKLPDEIQAAIRADRYIIFYRFTPKGIEIVRVLHGARDLNTIFNEDY